MTVRPVKVLLVMTSPLDGIAHALRVAATITEQRPEVEFTWVARDSFAPLVEAFACVGKTIPFYRKEGVAAWLGLVRRLRRERYDLALDFEGHARSGLMCWLARSGRRIGLARAREGATVFYGELLGPPANGSRHLLDAMLEFARVFGLEPRPTAGPQLRESMQALPEEWRAAASGQRVCLFPGRFKRERCWPGMFDLAARVLRERPRSRVFILGIEPKVGLPGGLASERLVDLQGKVDWGQSLRMLEEADLTVGSDNGVAQVAALFGRPNVTLYTMVDPERRGSYPVGAAVNVGVQSPGGRPQRLLVDEVWQALEKLLPL